MKPTDLQVRHRYATINGVQLHFVEAGPSTGPIALLLHGFPEMWWSWRHQIQVLADAGFQVIAPDLRGYNDSEKHGPYDMETLVEDACGLIRYLGRESAHIIGHDWGGAIAWQLAATRPEYCDRLVVMNCPHPRMYLRALRIRPRQMLKSWYVLAFQIPKIPEFAIGKTRGSMLKAMYRASAIDPTHFSDEEITPMIEAMAKPGVARAAVDYYRTMAAQALRRVRGPKLNPVQSQTLLIWAKNDAALDFDSLVPGTHEYAPHLRVETIEECGHFVQEEQPERVNDLLLGFLGRD